MRYGTPQYTGLTVDAVRDENDGLYYFVVNIEGAQVPLGATQIGAVDDAVKLAAQEQASAPTTPPVG